MERAAVPSMTREQIWMMSQTFMVNFSFIHQMR